MSSDTSQRIETPEQTDLLEIFAVGDRTAVAGWLQNEGPSDLQVLAPEAAGRIRMDFSADGSAVQVSWLATDGPAGEVEDLRIEALRVAIRVAQKRFRELGHRVMVEPSAAADAQLLPDGFVADPAGFYARPGGPFPGRPEKAKDADGVYADPMSTPWNFVPAEVPAYAALATAAPARVLDLGCGHGKNSRILQRYGHEVVGIDVSARAIERCRVYLPDLEFHAASAAGLPFADDSFDTVVDVGCLHFLDDETRAASVRELARVLRPGGVLYSRMMRPRPAAWLAAQPFETTGLGLTGEQIEALFADGFEITELRPDTEVHYIQATPKEQS